MSSGIPLLALISGFFLLHSAASVRIYIGENAVNGEPTDFGTYILTNGDQLITASIDTHSQVLVDCDLSTISSSTQNLLNDNSTKSTEVKDDEWTALLEKCKELTRIYHVMESVGKAHLIRKREVKKSGRTTVRPTHIPPSKAGNLLLYEGTNWCGSGNKATHYDDLGQYAEVDKCCRSHDYCKEFISGFTTRYNYSNWRPYTISRCECDYDFYTCLKGVNSVKANEIGGLFFHTIGVPCFNFEYGKYCADESSFFTCSEYKYGSTVTLNFVLSRIWENEAQRISLVP